MEIIREYKKPESNQIVLDIPKRFVDKELEILIIPVGGEKKKKTINKKKLFQELCGIWADRDDLSLKDIRDKAWKMN